MDSIEEKRVYGDRAGAVTAYVASAMGIVRVRVAGDTVGEFGLCERCSARDIAAGPAAVAIATDEDVRVLALEDGAGTNRSGGDGGDDENVGDASIATEEETFVGTGFGPAVAVGYDDDGDLLAADPDGRVACQSADSSEWTALADETVAPVRAIDGDLVGTADGVYRVQDGGLDHAGLTDVRDVSAAGVPLAATADGLYKLGNGWMAVLEGAFDAVGADPRSEPGRLVRAHAVTDEAIYEYAPDDDAWRESDRSTDSVIGFSYGETTYAVTEQGAFLAGVGRSGGTGHVGSDGEWRTRTLGVRDVTGIAIPRRE
ncbi:hypothetical protein CP556_07760 [Natrinema sp. CBA1119]|uniref:HVO_0234 family beta-propeller protein n=1 Tax=Natrinema sp. CBA1119 TaxID=1608465 RepID=UPI000BF30A0D|nr:hypothetical protein [Natrinema sp. CBA1119]PGF16022.1 hypothetical protein CP556_07760 [Natrinema sp. CBA1119]